MIYEAANVLATDFPNQMTSWRHYRNDFASGFYDKDDHLIDQ